MTANITVRSWIMVATLGFVWGASFIFIELALVGIGPAWLAASRILLAALLTHFVWLMRGGNLYPTAEKTTSIALISVGAMSTALPFMLISWGQQSVTAGFAGISMAAVALIVLPLAHVFVPGERMTFRRVVGFVIGFAGVVVLIGPEAVFSGNAVSEWPGRLACLGGAACYAVSSIAMRRLPPVDPIGLSAVTLWIGAAIIVPLALVAEGLPPMPSMTVLSVIVILGLIQTAAANLLRISVIRSAGPVFMSLTNYQVPVWSVILGVIFLSEVVTPSLFVALALILIGVFLSQWGALRRLFAR